MHQWHLGCGGKEHLEQARLLGRVHGVEHQAVPSQGARADGALAVAGAHADGRAVHEHLAADAPLCHVSVVRHLSAAAQRRSQRLCLLARPI